MPKRSRPLLVLAALTLAAPVLAEPAAPPAPSARPKTAAREVKNITIDVKDADIHNVLRLFADVSDKNFVVGDDVKGTVTLKLKSVPWPDALQVVLQSKALGQVEDGNIIRIRPQAVLDNEEQRALDLAALEREKGPLVTRMLPVNYARAEEMAAVVRPLLTARGTCTVDERTNTIIVRDVKGSKALSAF
jgi:type IV pilus assembly protein PilQ